MSIKHQLVKYCLNADGTIPDYLLEDNDSGISGQYAVYTNEKPWPQNMYLIGLTSITVSSDEFETVIDVFETKEQLSDYLSSFLSGKTERSLEKSTIEEEDPENSGNIITKEIIIEKEVPIIIDDKVNYLWDFYLKANSIISQ